MNKLLAALLFLLFSSVNHAFAQELKSSFSPVFEEPKDLDARIFQCSNGNTLLFLFSKAGINVTVYDPSRKVLAKQLLSNANLPAGAVMQSNLSGIFAQNDAVILLVQYTKGSEPGLYRLNISSADGKLKEVAKIADIAAYKAGAGYAMLFGGIKEKTFFVQKDAQSNAYAIVVFDPFEETSKRIMLKLFDGNNQEVSSGYYAFSEEQFKYIDYIGMAVRGTNEVALCTYEYNTRSSGGKSNRLVVSSFKNGNFTQHTIDSADELKRTEGIFLYNPTANLYQLLTVTAQGAKGGFFTTGYSRLYSSLILAINPEDYRVVWGGGIDNSKLEAIMKEWKGKKGKYTGVPVYGSVNADGSFEVLLQDITQISSDRGSNKTLLGDIGLIRYSAKGEQLESSVVPASLLADRTTISPLYLKGMDVLSAGVEQQRGWYLGSVADPGFYYFNFVSTPKGALVFLNQHPKDFDKAPAKTNGILSGVSDANAVAYRVAGDQLSKFHLFGEPKGDVDNRFALFSTGNYSAETGDYAVLVFEHEGRDKKLRVGWLHCK